jgi:polyribonucleotide 5'-hydroxyl-kinase
MNFMPGGVEATESEQYEKVEPGPLMLHCLLAVMYASAGDLQDTIRDASVMGFVFVTEVDEKKRRMKVLAPMNTRISDRPMVWGSWPEATISLIS